MKSVWSAGCKMVPAVATDLLPLDDEGWEEEGIGEAMGQNEVSKEDVVVYLVLKMAVGPISMAAIANEVGGMGGARNRVGRSAIKSLLETGAIEQLPTYPPMYRLRDGREIPPEGAGRIALLEQAIEWFGLSVPGKPKPR